MVSAAFAGGGAGAGLGTQRALQAQKPERGVWGNGGLWGWGWKVGGGFYFPPFFPNRAGLRGQSQAYAAPWCLN